MKCNHSETEYCNGPAVRFALTGDGYLVTRCEAHYALGLNASGIWLFLYAEVTEQEAEVWLVHQS
jgi:hypothetical protein